MVGWTGVLESLRGLAGVIVSLVGSLIFTLHWLNYHIPDRGSSGCCEKDTIYVLWRYEMEGFWPMVTREQIKAARAVLGWSTRDLAERTGVAPNTVSRFENGADALGETLTKLQTTLEAQGIEFVKLDAIRWTRYLEAKGQEQSA